MGFGDDVTDVLVPANIALDTSFSMNEVIGTVSKSVNNMIGIGVKNPTLCERTRVTVNEFNTNVKTICKYCRWDEIPEINLKATGSTNMAEALGMIITDNSEFKRSRTKEGYHVAVGEAFIMSDGQPDTSVEEVIKELKKRQEAGKINVHCIGFGEYCDMNLLRKIDPSAVRIYECDLKLYFETMGQVLAAISEDPDDKAVRKECSDMIVEQLGKEEFCPESE